VGDIPHFYFDLASPLAYLAAEQVRHALPADTEWHPVLERELPGGIGGPAGVFRCQNEQDICVVEIERRALALGLQPMRWPPGFPFDSEPAMRVATYAKSIGRGVAFAQAAFRQAFAAGHDLANLDFVLIAAAACEMHPRAVLQSIERTPVQAELRSATELAISCGVQTVPAVRVDGRVFEGEQQLQQAAIHATSVRKP
jgi:2-hydroxychromene-2-carboxylate isomerase